MTSASSAVAGMVAVALLGRVAARAYGPGAPGFGLEGDTAAHLAATGAAFGSIALIASLAAATAAVLALTLARPVR